MVSNLFGAESSALAHSKGEGVDSLGQDHSVDTSRVTSTSREVPKRAIELGELVDGLVTDERLADEDDFVGIVDLNEL